VTVSERFAFGKNWIKYVADVDCALLEEATSSLEQLVAVELAGKRFLDAGCGSGIMSLAASVLGAEVTAVDLDADSVTATLRLLDAFGDEQSVRRVRVRQGSVLDASFLERLGPFDVVYSWGVVHHTGHMWRAIELLSERVVPGGIYCLAIYNDQGLRSHYWRFIKRHYCRTAWFRWLISAVHWPVLVGLRKAIRVLGLRKRRARDRGMDLTRDMHDWLGGYPFQTATPVEVVNRVEGLGFLLREQRLVGRSLGCNEYVFVRVEDS